MEETVINAVFIEDRYHNGNPDRCGETITLGGLIATLEKLKSQYGEDYDPPVYLTDSEKGVYGKILPWEIRTGTYIEGVGTTFDDDFLP